MNKYVKLFAGILLILILSQFYWESTVLPNKSFSYEYFPEKQNVKLIYNSPFGESTATYNRDGENTIFFNESNDFKYRQKFRITSSGVYVIETYQHIKIFLFLNKEGNYTYDTPLLRYPIPFTKEWTWRGVEDYEGDTTSVEVNGKMLGEEEISTTAGRFKTTIIETTIKSSSGSKNKVTEWLSPGVGLVKMNATFEGGGIMRTVRDIMGYGKIEFVLKEIKP